MRFIKYIPYYKAEINEDRFSISIIEIDNEITYLFLN
jgi:hypothetical protein